MPPEVRELRELRRELAQARAENKDLNERLLKKSAELQSALVEVDKTKVNVVELKSQLAQTTTSLENIKKDGAAVPGIRAEFEKKYADILRQFPKCRPIMTCFRRKLNACSQSSKARPNTSQTAIPFVPACLPSKDNSTMKGTTPLPGQEKSRTTQRKSNT